jgi:hypothetical protein
VPSGAQRLSSTLEVLGQSLSLWSCMQCFRFGIGAVSTAVRCSARQTGPCATATAVLLGPAYETPVAFHHLIFNAVHG